MKKYKPLSSFTKSQQKGVFYFIGVLVLIQLAIEFYPKVFPEAPIKDIGVYNQQQNKIEEAVYNNGNRFNLKPFNPNFISDYKGYLLGLSVEELDRLFAYREKGLFVNSKEEFGKVTEVSDSLLQKIAPYFKFPEFVNKEVNLVKIKVDKADINSANAIELTAIRGVGPVLSKRIISYRNSLGRFDSIQQLYKVYGLDTLVVHRLMKNYTIK